MKHPVFQIVPTLANGNGFDVVECGGKTYLRVIAEGEVQFAVPQGAAELRQLAAMMLNAADAVEGR